MFQNVLACEWIIKKSIPEFAQTSSARITFQHALFTVEFVFALAVFPPFLNKYFFACNSEFQAVLNIQCMPDTY